MNYLIAFVVGGLIVFGANIFDLTPFTPSHIYRDL